MQTNNKTPLPERIESLIQDIIYEYGRGERHSKHHKETEYGSSFNTDAFVKERAQQINLLLVDVIDEVVPDKKILKVEQPHLYQGVGGGSAPFFCSACQMGETKIMDNKEGDKYFCDCSYWTDPHNAYIDKSGGKWLGWKDKIKAQEYLNNLPIEENGYNQAIKDIKSKLIGEG